MTRTEGQMLLCDDSLHFLAWSFIRPLQIDCAGHLLGLGGNSRERGILILGSHCHFHLHPVGFLEVSY